MKGQERNPSEQQQVSNPSMMVDTQSYAVSDWGERERVRIMNLVQRGQGFFVQLVLWCCV